MTCGLEIERVITCLSGKVKVIFGVNCNFELENEQSSLKMVFCISRCSA